MPRSRPGPSPSGPAQRAACSVGCLLLLSVYWPGSARAAEGLLLAGGGRSRLPVVISGKAPEATRAVAAELAAYLGKIAGRQV
jgi:hypothetical protein